MYDQAFESFMSESFENAVDSATKGSWKGDLFYVELLRDGSFNVFWYNPVGSLYVSPGLMLQIPALSDDDWNDDPSIRYYGNAEEYFRDYFQEVVSSLFNFRNCLTI